MVTTARGEACRLSFVATIETLRPAWRAGSLSPAPEPGDQVPGPLESVASGCLKSGAATAMVSLPFSVLTGAGFGLPDSAHRFRFLCGATAVKRDKKHPVIVTNDTARLSNNIAVR